MDTFSDKLLHEAKKGDRSFVSLYERTYNHNGQKGSYFFASRRPPENSWEKTPDAVVIVAFHEAPHQPKRLVLTSEYRVPIGCNEISFPAGLIDPSDYVEGHKNVGVEAAACKAAVREMAEETGFNLTITDVSPHNLYSSAGLTNESICMVFGLATGNSGNAKPEATEDITTMLYTEEEVRKAVNSRAHSHVAYSKVVWPFLWLFARKGF